jgi:hypothetical protein
MIRAVTPAPQGAVSMQQPTTLRLAVLERYPWLRLESGDLPELPATAARFDCSASPGTDAPETFAGAARFGPVEGDDRGEGLAPGVDVEDQAPVEASLHLMAGAAGVGVLAGDRESVVGLQFEAGEADRLAGSVVVSSQPAGDALLPDGTVSLGQLGVEKGVRLRLLWIFAVSPFPSLVELRLAQDGFDALKELGWAK